MQNTLTMIAFIIAFVLLLAALTSPIMILLYKMFKIRNLENDLGIADRYLLAKKREQFKQLIILKLAKEDYYLNKSFSWYHFKINEKKHVFSIIELLEYFGDDLFDKVKYKKSELLKIRPVLKIIK